MIRRRLAIAAFFVLLAGADAPPAETTTEAEKTYRELRNSDDVKSKLMAERWYSVIKLQDWTSENGKFKTTAKYLEHDPKLAWVKLRVIEGTGDKRVVKDVTIPMDKLSKDCQARVRQISVLADKMTAAIEDAKKDKEKKDTEGGGREEGRDGHGKKEKDKKEKSRGRRGKSDAELASMDAEQAMTESAQGAGNEGREPIPGQPAVATDGGEPLPAVIPALPSTRIPQAASAESAEPQSSNVPADAAGDEEAWRTNYDAFRENIKPQGSRELAGLDWGVLHALKDAHETLVRVESTGSVGDAELAEIRQKLDAVGEVNWETTLTQESDQHGDWTAALGLPALSPPMELAFILDPERDPGGWQNLKAGDHVRFVGRFYAFHEQSGITVAIRFPEQQPASDATAADAPRH